EEGVQRLNQEVAKVIANARRIGLDVRPERAIRWITSNPARAMGIGDRTGTIREQMAADVVVWDRNPFSVYALAELVFIDGALRYDRRSADRHGRSDFLIGQRGETQ